MAMIIYNNVPSLTGQRFVGVSNSNLAKSLEKLSSGLRINHASDDASGLAISEKLRGQISGLKRASMNAQDGISMLQTAEGAMGEVQSILQRMRELSVQASNGIYTTNDRKYIQDEVDQLKAEINRISSSTEFNTKKLLNGDATALWSTDKSDKLSAIIRSKVAEGNYNINLDVVNPGSNYVYKSDVMTLNEGALGAMIDTAIGSTPDANDTNVSYVKNPISMPTTGTAYFTVTIGAASSNNTDTAALNGVYQQAGSAWTVALGTAVNANFSGYVEIEFLKDYTGTAAVTDGFRYRTIDASTGVVGSWTTDDIGAAGIKASALGSIVSASITVTTGQKVTAGDKILIAVSDLSSVATGVTASGGGSIRLSGGPTGYTGPTIEYASGQLTKKDNGDTTVDYNDVTVYYAQLDQSTGNLNLGNITLGFKEQSSGSGATYAPTDTGNFRMTIKGGGEAATTTTKLKDIARFTTADGRNLFDNTQELTVFGNGKSATIYLEGDDTIADFEKKLTDAIVSGLGMGYSSSVVNNNLVNYVSPGTAVSGTNEAVNGTFVIQTALLGNNSQLAFIGDQALIDGLSLATIQEGEESAVKVTVTNAHTGENIGSDIVNDSTIRGIIKGVDVEFASNIDTTVSWSASNRKISFAGAAGSVDLKLHLVDNATELQIGANEGQTILTTIGQMDTRSLGIDDVYMVSQELAQKSITKIDRALEIVSAGRATIGAQVNRLEYAISNLNVTRENLVAAESRIRDLDVAAEMANFTRWQILNQSGTAMLAQANQLPQMALQLLR
ncbi:MAG: flagellin [Calditerrivibrio sp.]|nr:flagellin [Calditerrivibrio sp.]